MASSLSRPREIVGRLLILATGMLITSSTYIFKENTDQTDLDLNTDDYVRVRGEVLGSFEGENAFGGSITAPTVQASKVGAVSAGQAVDPAVEVLEVNRTVGGQGFDVTLQKKSSAGRAPAPMWPSRTTPLTALASTPLTRRSFKAPRRWTTSMTLTPTTTRSRRKI
jgi:hypothetical protein